MSNKVPNVSILPAQFTGNGNPSQTALDYNNAQAEQQARINSSLQCGGYRFRPVSRNHYLLKKRLLRKKGGASHGTVTVPTFPNVGPSYSPQNANSAIVLVSQNSVNNQVDGMYDPCLTKGACPPVNVPPQSGGRRKHQKSKRNLKKRSIKRRASKGTRKNKRK